MGERFFNTTGPCNLADHYMLPAAERLGRLRTYVDRKQYAVLHAARQSGKTTALDAFTAALRAEGRYAPFLFSCEVGATFPDLERAEPVLLAEWRRAAWTAPADERPPPWPEGPAGSRIALALSAWARACPRPLVLCLDEVDALRDEVLISLLRQLRSGFRDRPGGFPQSIVLVGMRDVRDYALAAGSRLGTASPFNVKVESLTLTDFSRAEVGALLGEHTAATGQWFDPAAVDAVFDLARGQPWLTNALAAELVDVEVPERQSVITAASVQRAAATVVRRRDTHLDSLAVRLSEPRVRAVIEPLVAGETLARVSEDDRQFAVDLGLVRRSEDGGLEIANPLYANVIGRALAGSTLDAMPPLAPRWLDPGGELQPERLVEAFLEFWRRNAEPLLRSATYPEIAPHLVMMAFLDRVANGGGTVDREFAAGTGRIDLVLRYRGVALAFELKAWRDPQPDPAPAGLAQLDGYLQRLSLPTGWLVVFDERAGRAPVAVRTAVSRAKTPSGREVWLVRA